MWDSFWLRFFELLEKHLPTMVASFLFGKKVGEKNLDEAEIKLGEVRFELKKYENEKKVREDNKGKSSIDILMDAKPKGKK